MALVRIPALIDPHIHLIQSDVNHIRFFAETAKRAGYWAVQIMPDLDPPIVDKISLAYYAHLSQETAVKIYLTVAGTPENKEAIKQLRAPKAIKIWLGTGPEDLVVTKEEELRQLLLSTDKVVMIHTEDENSLLRNFDLQHQELNLARHQEIFDRKVAIRAAIKAITAAKETGRRVYLCHISTGEEVELVRQAKSQGLRVYAEVAPHHLFLVESDLERLKMLGKVNPPLRSREDQIALWQGINDGTIDTIGSDTYAWWQEEKETTYDQAPAGFPNLELTLPLLLTAVREKRVTFQRVVELTSINPARIFSIPKPTRGLFVDIDTPRFYQPRLSNWHPYDLDKLVGWPVVQREEKNPIVI